MRIVWIDERGVASANESNIIYVLQEGKMVFMVGPATFIPKAAWRCSQEQSIGVMKLLSLDPKLRSDMIVNNLMAAEFIGKEHEWPTMTTTE